MKLILIFSSCVRFLASDLAKSQRRGRGVWREKKERWILRLGEAGLIYCWMPEASQCDRTSMFDSSLSFC